MTRQGIYTGNKTVDRLISAVTEVGFAAAVLPTDGVPADGVPVDEALEEYSLKEVLIQIKGQEFCCLLNNEYGDVDQDNLPLLLNMLLVSLEEYDEADDYLEWARGHGLNAGNIKVDGLWTRLQENVAAIRPLLPAGLRPISDWDWSMAAGDAQILRQLPRQYARPDRPS